MFRFDIDETKPTPKYQQIIDQVKLAISTGKLKPGDRLPNQAQMLDEYGVWVATAARAYRELAQEGLIFSKRSQGTFVTEETPRKSKIEKNKQLTERTQAYLADIAPLGVTMTEIIANIRQHYKREGAK